MPTERDIAAFRRNTKRNRTPKILSVIYKLVLGSETLIVTFDRPMDTTRDTAVFRHFMEGIGVQEFDDGAWQDERTYEASSMSLVTASYTGRRNVRYMSGDIRAKARYYVDNGERCDRVEDRHHADD